MKTLIWIAQDILQDSPESEVYVSVLLESI